MNQTHSTLHIRLITLSPYSHITMITGVSEIHLPYSPNNNDSNCTITPCRERTLWGRAS